MQITYISHGLHETGGYIHEKSLASAISDNVNRCDICFKDIRFRKLFKGPFGWLLLFVKSFFNAKGDVIITVARLAWPVYLRNIFNHSKIILVIHNLDEKDGKPKIYFRLLHAFFKMASAKTSKIAIVVISNYWKKILEEKHHFTNNIFVYPNLMENGRLQFFKDIVKKKSNLVHLGQWSDKIDKKAYLVFIDELQKIGLACYFSDNTGIEITDYPVSYFKTHEAYLKQMALSKCTVILNKIQEGWNRVAHESFLVGTQVISNGGGGLSELIQISNGYLISSPKEILEIINKEPLKAIDFHNLEKFDKSNTDHFLLPILNQLRIHS